MSPAVRGMPGPGLFSTRMGRARILLFLLGIGLLASLFFFSPSSSSLDFSSRDEFQAFRRRSAKALGFVNRRNFSRSIFRSPPVDSSTKPAQYPPTPKSSAESPPPAGITGNMTAQPAGSRRELETSGSSKEASNHQPSNTVTKTAKTRQDEEDEKEDEETDAAEGSSRKEKRTGNVGDAAGETGADADISDIVSGRAKLDLIAQDKDDEEIEAYIAKEERDMEAAQKAPGAADKSANGEKGGKDEDEDEGGEEEKDSSGWKEEGGGEVTGRGEGDQEDELTNGMDFDLDGYRPRVDKDKLSTADDGDTSSRKVGATGGKGGGKVAGKGAGGEGSGKDQRLVIAVTPTYPRAMQAIYLLRLTNLLRVVGPAVLWIVVEAANKVGACHGTATMNGMSSEFYPQGFSP